MAYVERADQPLAYDREAKGARIDDWIDPHWRGSPGKIVGVIQAPGTVPALRLFGDVSLNGKSFPGPRAKALIVALSLSNGRPVSANDLIADVWGLDAPGNAPTALHTMVSRIRTGHGTQFITSSPAGYSLNLRYQDVDFWAVHALLETGADTQHDAVTQLSHARHLLEEDAAPGTADSPALDDFKLQAASLRNRVDRRLAKALLAAGQAEEAASILEKLTAAEPNDEALALLLIRALRSNDRANAAMVVYEKLSRRLRRELGTDPSPALQTAHRELLQETIEASVALPPVPSLLRPVAPLAEKVTQGIARQMYGLRAPTDELVGRTRDLESVSALMASNRLTTILGTGGLGKTRMAFALANQESDAAQKSVIVIELAGLRTAADIWLALADAAGIADARTTRAMQEIRSAKDLKSRTLAKLAAQPLLLVLDNCEHLVNDAALVTAEILANCPSTTVLTTSRAPLGLLGEQLFQLRTLNHHDVQTSNKESAAVQLFLRRALAARSSASLDVAVVREICQHLDGLPLAIELAAAKVRMMSVEDINRRLRSDPRLLVNADKSAPERHRTLAAVISWSWELLEHSEHLVLRRLVRFPSGFSLDAAVKVARLENNPITNDSLSAADVESALEGLINQSLVLSFEDSTTGTLRFRILETVREFGTQKLIDAGEEQAVDQALTQWAVDFSGKALFGLAGAQQLSTGAQITAEQENLVHVLRRAMSNEKTGSESPVPAQVLTIFGLLSFYWSQRGMHTEVFEFTAPVLAATQNYQPDPESINSAVFACCIMSVTSIIFNFRQGIMARIRLKRIMSAGLVVAPRFKAMAQLALGVGRSTGAELLEQMRKDPNPDVAAFALLASAMLAENSAADDKARYYANKAFELAENIHDTWIAGTAADNLAQFYSQAGQAAQSVAWAEKAIERMELVGAGPDIWQATLLLATNLAGMGQTEKSLSALKRLSDIPPGESLVEAQAMLAVAAAEIAFALGQKAKGLALYRSINTRVPNASPRSAENMSFGPMGQIFNAIKICAEALYDPAPEDNVDTTASAARLRRYVLASNRLNANNPDLPVLGTLCMGLATWQLRLAAPQTRAADVGLELLALAERLRSRQDQPVMSRVRHQAAAREKFGAAAWDSVKQRVDERYAVPAEAAKRFIELLTDPVFVPKKVGV